MFYPRKIYKILSENIKNSKIVILTGARQVGKTTLMKMLYEQVNKKTKAIFIDMDLISNQEIGENLENFINHLIFNGYNEKLKRFYVFIDEFQRAPKLAMILKNIYDHYSNIKVFASGSSSLSIKNKIKESLAGRKFVFEIYPLDFEEFLEFKQDAQAKKYFNNIVKVKGANIALPAKLNKLLEEFLIFGGYPEVILSSNPEKKKQILKSIFDLYIEKDVMMFLGVEKVWAYKKIIQLLAVNNGQIINYNNLAQEAGVHNKTIRSYLSLLEDTYLIQILSPFFSNKQKEITKSPKIYFLDNGARNYFLNNFNVLEKRTDKGGVFENYVLQEIVKNNIKNYNIKFWRTKEKQEVDFIFEKRNILIPIAVKIKSYGKTDDHRNVLTFLTDYKQQKGYILSKNFNQIIQKHNKKIHFIPAINFVHFL